MPSLPPPPDPASIAVAMAPRGSGDLQCLSEAVYYEARGESAAGQAAVAQVVLNRLARPSFPKSVCGVVYQRLTAGGCQFSFVCDGAMRRPLEPAAWERARLVAQRALAGERGSVVGEATSFHAVRLGDVWGPRMIQVAQIGGHDFYSPAGGLQRRAAAPPVPGGARAAPVRYTFSLGLLVRVSDGAPAEANPVVADEAPPAPAAPSGAN
jgi:Cell Wall Hydrolase